MKAQMTPLWMRLVREHAHRTGMDGQAAAADLVLTTRKALVDLNRAMQPLVETLQSLAITNRAYLRTRGRRPR